MLPVRGIRLYYEEHGNGPPVLCVHGTGSSARTWDASVSELARAGRTIVYDRRGCARSERSVRYNDTSVEEHADDAAALLHSLSAEPAAVIGRSYGGGIAIDLALRYPERVRGLVLLEAATLGLSVQGEALWRSLWHQVRAAAEVDMTSVGETLMRIVIGDAAWEAFPASIQQMYADNGPAIVAELAGGYLQVNRTSLATIAAPTLVVAATSSSPVFRQVADVIADAVPHSRKLIVEGGHQINPAGPAILKFLEDLPGQGRRPGTRGG
jgi:pimeloyl-ACP methyl ester carboxylesterase